MLTMRIGVTCRFQNSYFSGATPQLACSLAKVLADMGHNVCLLYPEGESDWFIDVQELSSSMPPRKQWKGGEPLDLLVELVWNFPAEVRSSVARRIALFHHYSPMFHDMESSVYVFNPTKRDFVGVTEVWTWSHYDKQDLHYLEFLSGKPVFTIPYIWNPDALDIYVKESNVPFWKDTAKQMDSRVVGDVPRTLSWCARIVESNMSNTSHCLIPLNIVSEIRKQDPIRFTVHNGETVVKNAFFQSNVLKNLLLPDISGNFVPRIRLPDLCRDKAFLLSHQRFRPIKTLLLDALYLGIPLLHNCDMLKDFGYVYELNQIQDAAATWRQMKQEYADAKGYFAPNEYSRRRTALRNKFHYFLAQKDLKTVLDADVFAKIPGPSMTITEVTPSLPTLRVGFCDMWDQFVPSHNFFMSLLKWTGAQHGFNVTLHYEKPDLVIYGPFGNTHEQYKGVPKIFYTGENMEPRKGHDTFLNLGYRYMTESDYIRLPLWVLEINWFGEDPNNIQNPRPVSLESCLKQDPEMIKAKKKFCAFVATNSKCQNRNVAFHILNQWRGVDSGGRLFCNLPSGPIPAGLGGGGGEMEKVKFYKDYKYVIAFENESSPGYTTEKLFHAKVAGCVPIYWGDKMVDRDFDSKGFLNANMIGTPQELTALVETLEKENNWEAMASVPALSEFKKHWCQKTMEEIAKQIVTRILHKTITFREDAWNNSTSFHSPVQTEEPNTNTNTNQEAVTTPIENKELPAKRRIVTAANNAFIQGAKLLVQSVGKVDKVPIRVWVWPEVSEADRTELQTMGAEVRVFPTHEVSWEDYWNPKHFAWKIWLQHQESATGDPEECVIYMDSGIELVKAMPQIWTTIQEKGFVCLEDNDQTNRRWCHPTFCEALQVTEEELDSQQILAGFVGFKPQGPFHTMFEEALEWSKKQEVIQGEKWNPYSTTCMGHRHDQSILSILTWRAKAPRLPHKDYYCDRSRRCADAWGTPLYVHRGSPRHMVPVAPGIDEAYVINMENRKDRLESFKQNATLKDMTYVWKATNGRNLKLTPELARLFQNNDFKWKKSVMGCALSHMELWQKLANDPIANSYLIMEDDVCFQKDWFAKWMMMSSKVPTDTDIIYLGGVLPPNKPAFPTIVEPVNDTFARVAKNSLFGPGSRRYFHFCNYSYIMTKTGAQKMMRLIQEKGIFTSGDHMIVNHGEYFNIYFTTPLLTECIQENDPVYVKSDFNNFARLDTFDSDLWNNNDHFSQEDIIFALAEDMKKIDIKVIKEPISDEERKRLNEEHHKKMEEPQPQPQPQSQSQPQLATPQSQSQSQPATPQPQSQSQTQPQSQSQSQSQSQTQTQLATPQSQSQPQPQSQSQPQPQPILVAPTAAIGKSKEETIKFWNDFLRAVAMRKSEDIHKYLSTLFKRWNVHDDILNEMSWFRIFEQLILTDHPEIQKNKQMIVSFIQGRKDLQETVWNPILKHLGVGDLRNQNVVVSYSIPEGPRNPVYHLEGVKPGEFFEHEWLNRIFPSSIEWKSLTSLQPFLEEKGMPVLLYMNLHDRNMTPAVQTICNVFQQQQRKFVLLHISDEYARDDISMYDSPSIHKVIRNYWRPNLNNKVIVLPLGFANGHSGYALPESPSFAEREHMWAFAGSLDRPGREEALVALRHLQPHNEQTKSSWSSPMKVEGPQYNQMLRNAKFIPCMKGSVAMESFRLYEALEHGAIPFYVPSESHDCDDEYKAIFGALPVLAVPSWKEASTYLSQLAENPTIMELHRKEVYNWWQQKKQEYTEKIKQALQA